MKKFLAVLLAVMMVVSMLPTHAFAAEENKYFSDEAIAAGEEKIEEVLAAVELVMELVPEYYDEAYADAYAYALENGYIEVAINGIEIAIDAINSIDLGNTEITAESQANIYAELAATVATLEELKAVLENGAAEDVEGLVESVMALQDDLYNHLYNLSVFTKQAGEDVYELVYLPLKGYVEEVVIPQAIEAANEVLRQTYAHLVEKIGEIYGVIVDVNMTVENIIEAVRDHIIHITMGDVELTDDFFYLAITDGTDGYADMVAAALNLTAEQYKKVTMDEVTIADMLRADFITVGYSGVSAVSFTVEQILGVANGYVEYVKDFVEAVDTKLETNFPKVMDMIGIDVYETVMGTVESEYGVYLALVAGKEVTEMDWVALVGEENVAYIETVLSELRATLVEQGVTETISYSINVVEMANQMIAEYTDNLIKLNEEELHAALGEHAVFTIEIPVADLAVFAAESALYEFISYNKEYAEMIQTINTLNPEATVAVLGNYNRFDVDYAFMVDEVNFTLAEVLAQFGFEGFKMPVEVEDAIAAMVAMSVIEIPAGQLTDHVMGYYDQLIDMIVSFELPVCEEVEQLIAGLVEISDAHVERVVGQIEDVYTVTLPVTELLKLVAEYGYQIDALINASLNTQLSVGGKMVEANDVLAELAQVTSLHPLSYAVLFRNVYYVNISEARDGGNAYIASQILNALNVTCDHVYDNCLDTTCNRCGDVRVAPGHSFTNYVSNNDATCTEDGTKTAKCDYCDAINTVVDAGSALDHSFTNYVSNNDATCTEDGTKTAKCDRCDVTNTVVDEGSMLDHNYENGVCTECGAEDPNYTPEEPPVVEPPVVHVHTPAVMGGVEATCTQSGWTSGLICVTCGEVLLAQEEIPALGHTEVVEAAVAATCTTAGSTEGKTCSVCGKVLAAKTEIPALGHTEEVVAAVGATCTETGLTEGKKCSVCGETLVAQEEIPALGHKYESVVTAPTCSSTGYTTHTCSVCGHSYKDSTTAKREHKWDAGVIIEEPTCTKLGTKEINCIYDDCDACFLDKLVPALGHTEEVVAGREATCTTAGLTEGKKCSVCGETLVAQEEIPAKGHSFGEWTVTKEATKKEAGEESRSCACGETETREIPALGGSGNVGAIVGGSVGGVSVVAVAVYFFLKKKKLF